MKSVTVIRRDQSSAVKLGQKWPGSLAAQTLTPTPGNEVRQLSQSAIHG
jgi:hypothetical protein